LLLYGLFLITRILSVSADLSDSNNKTKENIVSLKGIHFSYGTRAIHTDLDLDIEQGSVTVIMGPSGCGKSTTLGYIGGRLEPKKGTVMVKDVDVTSLNNSDLYELRKSMGMMFQHNALLTDLTVFENVAFPIREHKNLSEIEISDIVLEKLELVGLRGAADLLPEECSGGMQRRVALARAIVMNPEVVMYDEPFTGLDPISKGVITSLIRKMNDQLNTTSIVVTHDVPEACQIADTIYILGAGKVIGKGSPEEMLNSSDPAIKQFMSGAPDGPVAFHYPIKEPVKDPVKGSVKESIKDEG